MRAFLLSLLLLSWVAPVQAGVFDVSAQLDLSGPFGVTTSATGSAAGVQSVGGGIAGVPTIPVSTTLAITSPTFSAFGLTGVGFQAALGAGALGGGGGALSLVGQARVFAGGPPAGLLPLTPIGGGGTVNGVVGGIFAVTLEGSSWQLGPVTASGTGTAMATGVDNRTAGGAGTVTFVTATTFRFSGAGSVTPATSSLTLTYTLAAPEPALALAGLGLGLMLVGSRARRSV